MGCQARRPDYFERGLRFVPKGVEKARPRPIWGGAGLGRLLTNSGRGGGRRQKPKSPARGRGPNRILAELLWANKGGGGRLRETKKGAAPPPQGARRFERGKLRGLKPEFEQVQWRQELPLVLACAPLACKGPRFQKNKLPTEGSGPQGGGPNFPFGPPAFPAGGGRPRARAIPPGPGQPRRISPQAISTGAA